MLVDSQSRHLRRRPSLNDTMLGISRNTMVRATMALGAALPAQTAAITPWLALISSRRSLGAATKTITLLYQSCIVVTALSRGRGATRTPITMMRGNDIRMTILSGSVAHKSMPRTGRPPYMFPLSCPYAESLSSNILQSPLIAVLL